MFALYLYVSIYVWNSGVLIICRKTIIQNNSLWFQDECLDEGGPALVINTRHSRTVQRAHLAPAKCALVGLLYLVGFASILINYSVSASPAHTCLDWFSSNNFVSFPYLYIRLVLNPILFANLIFFIFSMYIYRLLNVALLNIYRLN